MFNIKVDYVIFTSNVYLRMASSWLVVMAELQSLAMLSLLRAAPAIPGGTPLTTHYHHDITISGSQYLMST